MRSLIKKCRPSPRPDPVRLALALHEVGHAAAWLALGLEVDWAVAVGDRRGHVRVASQPRTLRRLPAVELALAAMLLGVSGEAAVRSRARSRPRWRAAIAAGDGVASMKDLRLIGLGTRLLAAELRRRAAAAAIGIALGALDAFFDRHRRPLARCARRLAERGTLEAPELERLLRPCARDPSLRETVRTLSTFCGMKETWHDDGHRHRLAAR